MQDYTLYSYLASINFIQLSMNGFRTTIDEPVDNFLLVQVDSYPSINKNCNCVHL